MFSEQFMKYILTYQKDDNKVKEKAPKATPKITKIKLKKKYATVPIDYTK